MPVEEIFLRRPFYNENNDNNKNKNAENIVNLDSAESAKGAYPNQGIIKLRSRIGSLRLTEA